MIAFVEFAKVRLDGGTQPRAFISEEVVADYAESYRRGDTLPPMVMFLDGDSYWLADGFHRYQAATVNGLRGADCDVRRGTQRDAILYSVGANAEHGLRRTNDDKRRAVLRLLNDPEWLIWSDREIARHCRVDHKTVATLRPRPAPAAADTGEIPSITLTARTFVHPKTSAPATMNTGNIGRRSTVSSLPVVPPITEPAAAPAREAVFAAARADMDAGAPIYDALGAIQREFAKLPDPQAAVRRFPHTLRHTFNPEQARHFAKWFRDFATAWARENGEPHVGIAAE